MERRHAVLALLVALLAVSMVGRTGAVEQASRGPGSGSGSGQDAAATFNQIKEIATKAYEVASPWLEWAKSEGRQLLSIVYEKASFQGLKSLATEASSISYKFFTGRPYQAAYQVAKDVPVVGSAVKDIVGEANLRKHAAREHEEEKKEL